MPILGPKCCCAGEECDKAAVPFVICGVASNDGSYQFNYQIRDASEAFIGRRNCLTQENQQTNISHLLDVNGDYDGSRNVEAFECSDGCEFYVIARNCKGMTECFGGCPGEPENCCTELSVDFAVVSFPDVPGGGCCSVMSGVYVLPGGPSPGPVCCSSSTRYPVGPPSNMESEEPQNWYNDVLTDEMIETESGECWLESDETVGPDDLIFPEGTRILVKWYVVFLSVEACLTTANDPFGSSTGVSLTRHLLRCTVRIYPDPPGSPPPPPTEVVRQIFGDTFSVGWEGCVSGVATATGRDEVIIFFGDGGSLVPFMPPFAEELCVTETSFPRMQAVVSPA